MFEKFRLYRNEHPELKPFYVILPIGIGAVLLYKIGYLIGKFIYYISNT